MYMPDVVLGTNPRTPLLSHLNDEAEETLVALLIEHLNASRRARGQSDVCVGALAPDA
jgi:hypothetical protein